MVLPWRIPRVNGIPRMSVNEKVPEPGEIAFSCFFFFFFFHRITSPSISLFKETTLRTAAEFWPASLTKFCSRIKKNDLFTV